MWSVSEGSLVPLDKYLGTELLACTYAHLQPQWTSTHCSPELSNCLIWFFKISVPEDLSLEEREELLDIRRRKKELIDDIEVKKKCLFVFALR